MKVKVATLIATLAVGLFVVPHAAEAQPATGKGWRIGALMSLYPPDAEAPQAFRQRLRTLGYVEGQNLVIEWRYAQARDDRLPGLAAELVRLHMDLIVADTTIATRAAMQATSTIPIVMTTSADAVGSGHAISQGHAEGDRRGRSITTAPAARHRSEGARRPRERPVGDHEESC